MYSSSSDFLFFCQMFCSNEIKVQTNEFNWNRGSIQYRSSLLIWRFRFPNQARIAVPFVTVPYAEYSLYAGQRICIKFVDIELKMD